ncbi:ATP-binding cassette domain-containing protein [Deinococcus misasensis]|uniref:ATP-binding cassette domain-containing protein n=1 Tax=Deinococcus misasensis TaxID=392413 RepID=UPI000550FF80|nr:ATP-binding cassette domain-containing protein [Deinococcus misasensis]
MGNVILAVMSSVLMALLGVGLMTSSGYLLSRAWERPETILLLMPIVTTVRFFGIGRAALRYAERLMSHEVTLQRIETTRLQVMRSFLVNSTYRLLGKERHDQLESIRRDTEILQNRFLTVTLPAVVVWTVTVLGGVGLFLIVGTQGALLWSGVAFLMLVVLPFWIRRNLFPLAQSLQTLRHQRSQQHRLQLAHKIELRFLNLPLEQQTETLDAQIRMLEVQIKRVQTTALVVRELALGGTLAFLLWQIALSQVPEVWMAGLWLGLVAASDVQVAFLNSVTEQVKVTLIRLPEPAPEQLQTAPTGETLAFVLPSGAQVTVKPGDRILITGPSGAGKSTLFEKLLGFRPLEAREATLDGQDLSGNTSRGELFAWAPQEPYLLDASLQENLGGFDERLVQQLDLPEDLAPETLLGEGGRNLSGGEKARLQLLRALLRPSPFLLLDEPTAHLDARTAARTLKALDQSAGKRAVVVITHEPEGFGPQWKRVEFAL